MDSELEEGEIEDGEISSSEESTNSPSSPSVKLTKCSNAVIHHEPQNYKLCQKEEQSHFPSPQKSTHHDSSRKRPLSLLIHSTPQSGGCPYKFKASESRQRRSPFRSVSPSPSTKQKSPRGRHYSSTSTSSHYDNALSKFPSSSTDDSCKGSISNHTTEKTETLRMGNSGRPNDQYFYPSKITIEPGIDTVITFSETEEIPMVNRREASIDRNKKGLSTSNDFREENNVTPNEKETSTVRGLDELEQKREALVALIKNLQEEEAKNGETTFEKFGTTSADSEFPFPTGGTSSTDETDMRHCVPNYFTPTKVSTKQRMVRSEKHDSPMKDNVRGRSCRHTPSRMCSRKYIRNSHSRGLINTCDSETSGKKFTIPSSSLVPAQNFLSPKDQRTQHNYNPVRYFEYDPSQDNPPCYIQQAIEHPKQSFSEISDDITDFKDDINALNDSIVSVLPTRKKSPATIEEETQDENVAEFSNSFSVPNPTPLETPLSRPCLPDLRHNLNARYNRYAAAALCRFTGPDLSSSVADTVGVSFCPEMTSSCVRKVQFSPLTNKGHWGSVVGSSGSQAKNSVDLDFESNAKPYIPSKKTLANPFYQRKQNQQHETMKLPMNFRRNISNDLNTKIISPVKNSFSEEEKSSNSPTEKISSPTISDLGPVSSNSSPVVLPTNFDAALDAMLKSVRQTVEAKEGKNMSKMSNESIQEPMKGFSSPNKENTGGKVSENRREMLTTDASTEKILPKNRGKLASSGTLNPNASHAKGEIAKQKEELELREKLLKSALVRKMDKSQLKLKLARKESQLIKSRMTASEMFTKLHSSMANYKDKKVHLQQLSRKMEKLKSAMESGQKQIQIVKTSAKIIAGEVLQSSKVAFAMGNKCMELTKICTELGQQVMGPLYKEPSHREKEMKETLKRVRDQHYEIKKYSEKYKNSGNIICLDSEFASLCPQPVVPNSPKSRSEKNATTSLCLRRQVPPYRIDVEPSPKQGKPIPILTDVHFIDKLTVEEETNTSIEQVDNLSVV